MTSTIDSNFNALVVKLKAEGYHPVHWKVHPKGVRVDQRQGKISIPSDFTKAQVCQMHGNLVKLRHETSPDRQDQGVRILDVLPCLFCEEDAVNRIERAPKTR